MWLEPREHVLVAVRVLAPVGAVVAALALCAVLIAWTGTGVAQAYGLLFEGALGSQFALAETLTRATPLILTGLAVAVAFRAQALEHRRRRPALCRRRWSPCVLAARGAAARCPPGC